MNLTQDYQREKLLLQTSSTGVLSQQKTNSNQFLKDINKKHN